MHMAPWVHTKDIFNPLSMTLKLLTFTGSQTGSYSGDYSELGLVNWMKDCLSGE